MDASLPSRLFQAVTDGELAEAERYVAEMTALRSDCYGNAQTRWREHPVLGSVTERVLSAAMMPLLIVHLLAHLAHELPGLPLQDTDDVQGGIR